MFFGCWKLKVNYMRKIFRDCKQGSLTILSGIEKALSGATQMEHALNRVSGAWAAGNLFFKKRVSLWTTISLHQN